MMRMDTLLLLIGCFDIASAWFGGLSRAGWVFKCFG